MRDSVRKVKSWITYDFQLNRDNIRANFTVAHKKHLQEYAYWNLEASRKKVISDFWYQLIFYHFSFLLSFGLLASIPFINSWLSLLFTMSFAGPISFITVMGFLYLPTYYSDFLPKLDTIFAEMQKLEPADEGIKKCKRTQFPIATLTIIFYIFSKTSSTPLLACNDYSAGLLNNLFGADRGKFKQNLGRLLKISSLSTRERAEIQKGIDTARTFFEDIKSPGAHKEIDLLERRLHQKLSNSNYT